MTDDFLNSYKQVLRTQVISVFFAIISVIHIRLLLANDWMFANTITFYTQFAILIIAFTTFTGNFLDRRWANVVMISVPYIFYWVIVLIISYKMIPTYRDYGDDNNGIGILILLVMLFQWSSVLIANIIGTYISIRNRASNK